MNKIIIFIIYAIFIASCSLNKNSKFWSATQNIPKEQQSNFKKIFVEEEVVGKELNTNVLINLGNMIDNDPKISHYFNNDGRSNYNGLLKKIFKI